MHTLDNLSRLGQLDTSNMLESIAFLPRQIEQAWSETEKLKIPANYKKINKVVINGMGGSGLGTHLIRSIYFKELKLPVGNIHSYDLPGLVDKNTLYLLSSYSGTTEEPLSTFVTAKKRGAKILGITSGGELAALIQNGKLPGYVFSPEKYNPCGQPRIGLGFSVAGILGLLNRCGIIKTDPREITRAIQTASSLNDTFSARTPFAQNPAKQIAADLADKIPVVIASEFLAGNAHVLANQLNENAKTFSTYFLIPELNHHLLEGMQHPKTNKNNLHFIFLESNLYHPRNQKRFTITKDILAQNKIKYSTLPALGNSYLEQSFTTLLFGSYLSFYLAILNNLDPSAIPYVDYFKEKLSH
ncbi:bifunctional phosphoglucose/phosphomannose isomerase [Candidatus Kuenenbacteria bacterium]|nr:bifunctional phosphoglucose/phosphomannose isomerase [Candidatus Kuenenbacteria bacterium]